MSVNENRNCSCNMNSDDNMMNSYSNNVSGTNYTVMNNFYNNSNTNDSMVMHSSNCNCDCDNTERTVDCDVRIEMIQNIRCLDFAINELALYLDTHPDDEKALCLHRKYCKEAKELKDKYQKVFGPLTINYPCNKWRWLEEPWPWERGNF